MATTDQRCDVSGLYLSTGACCHASQVVVPAGDQFGGCPKCGRTSQWTLLREMHRLERAKPRNAGLLGAVGPIEELNLPGFAPDEPY